MMVSFREQQMQSGFFFLFMSTRGEIEIHNTTYYFHVSLEFISSPYTTAYVTNSQQLTIHDALNRNKLLVWIFLSLFRPFFFSMKELHTIQFWIIPQIRNQSNLLYPQLFVKNKRPPDSNSSNCCVSIGLSANDDEKGKAKNAATKKRWLQPERVGTRRSGNTKRINNLIGGGQAKIVRNANWNANGIQPIERAARSLHTGNKCESLGRK